MGRRDFLMMTAGVAALPGAAIAIPSGDPPPASRLAVLLERDYVFPAVGRRYATMLRERQAAGAYDALAPAALAARMTEELQAVAKDGHLRVQTERSLPQPPGAGGARRSAALQDAAMIAPGIGYLRYTGFPHDDPSVAATADFMARHAGARALIVDCRYNGGGGIEQMNAILPWLYARETPLVILEMSAALYARAGSPFDGDAMIRDAPAPAGLKRQAHVVMPRTGGAGWADAEVVYLTSGRTASAAEHLALAFKRTGRATLIGETTAGANHFGGFEPLGEGLAAFVPVGRTFDPDTGRDWEETGIAPDVAAPVDRALEVALARLAAQ